MGYPTTYRRNAPPVRGPQTPPKAPPGTRRPLPVRPPPYTYRPPPPPRNPLPPGTGAVLNLIGRYAPKLLGRFVPFVGQLLTLWDVIDLLSGLHSWAAPGYVFHHSCGYPPEVGASETGPGCGVVQTPPGSDPPTYYGTPSDYAQAYATYYRDPSFDLLPTSIGWQIAEWYIRDDFPSFDPRPVPHLPIVSPPRVLPRPHHDGEPFSPFVPEIIPVGAPIGFPAPIPWVVAPHPRHNPNRSPVEQGQNGNEEPVPYPVPHPTPWPLPSPVPDPVPVPGPSPEHLPSDAVPGVTYSVGPRTRPVWRQAPHYARKPRGRTKEKKLILALKGVPAAIVGGVTEWGDLVGALYQALPKKYRYEGRSKDPNDLDRMGDAMQVFKHFGQIDWDKAIANLIKNEVEDFAIGRANRALNKAGRRAWEQGYTPRAGFTIGPAM